MSSLQDNPTLNFPQMFPSDQKQESHKFSPEETRQKLQKAIKGSGEILATATTVFTFFPDTLVLDRAKLTLTKRRFFRTAEVMSIRIEDLLNITTEVAMFLGSVKVMSRVANMEPYRIGNFWRNEAIHLKRVTKVILLHCSVILTVVRCPVKNSPSY